MKTYKALQSDSKAISELATRQRDELDQLHKIALDRENSIYGYKIAIVLLLACCVALITTILITLGAE